MDLHLDVSKALGYKSNAQIARVLTEDWTLRQVYCPNCGAERLEEFANNAPVADFYCATCQEEYELKSKSGNVGKKIVDGAFETMSERIVSANNPNFFFLNYNKSSWRVQNFMIIPNYFFTPHIIEKRKPLPPSARRAGWIGCNILLSSIPESGRIFYVKASHPVEKSEVLQQWQKTIFLRAEKPKSRGWLLDILACIEKIPKQTFTLRDIYAFETHLQAIHPENHFVRDKIRQQLQVLRDKGLVKFIARGRYTKAL
jgi:type II restriction enzyme